MFLKSKSKVLALVFSSFLVQSACTKDEASVQNPVKATNADGSDASQGANSEMAKLYSPVYFDFDSSAVKDSYHDQMSKISAALKSGNASVKIDGHCDERGTSEYNLALGSRRATEVKNMLVQMGVEEGKITTNSYGKERPVDDGHNEAAWQKNRRAEFSVTH